MQFSTTWLAIQIQAVATFLNLWSSNEHIFHCQSEHPHAH